MLKAQKAARLTSRLTNQLHQAAESASLVQTLDSGSQFLHLP